jgi:hypothetical protein
VKRALLLALVVALVAGCTAPIAGPWYVSAKFSPIEEQHIAEAARAWEAASLDGVHIDLVFGADVEPTVGSATGRRIIAKVTDAEWAASDIDDVQPVGLGVTETVREPSYSYQAMLLNVAIPPARFRATVMHEFGHSLGMVHVHDARALMCGDRPDCALDARDRFVAGGCIGSADVAELMRGHGDDLRGVQVCP